MSNFWQVRCYAHRTRHSCQKYDEDFSNFVAFSEDPNFKKASIVRNSFVKYAEFSNMYWIKEKNSSNWRVKEKIVSNIKSFGFLWPSQKTWIFKYVSNQGKELVKLTCKRKREINNDNILLRSVAHWKILPEIIQNYWVLD